MPCDYFPITILQNGVKLTNEPPKGIKANLLKNYSEFPENMIESCSKPEVWRNLLYSFSLFHSIVLERKKFGSLGWNKMYDFNDSDLETSLELTKIMLDQYPETPWEAIKYLTAEINYGGRVTDALDRVTLATILHWFCDEKVIEPNYSFIPSNTYIIPTSMSVAEVITTIQQLPDLDSPEIFGMNLNAEIIYQFKESSKLLTKVLELQPRDVVGGEGEKSPDEQTIEMIEVLLGKYPQVIAKEGERRPSIRNFNDSLEICLVQEIERFNKLLGVIMNSLNDLTKAIEGEIIMSEELDMMNGCLQKNKVPTNWEKVAYPS